jgi:sugar (pentulose or hexulose) kinase
MGTAESLLGTLPETSTEAEILGTEEYNSGLSYGCHVSPNRYYWLGGLSTSGGSIEWLRSILSDPPLSYAELDVLLEGLPAGSSGGKGPLFFPYLSGSGSPHTDTAVRGAFVGLSSSHRRADLLQAVLEGTAYEMELIRRTAEETMRFQVKEIIAAGGGTRNRRWMQVKADVSGCPILLYTITEATLFGSALLAGLGSGVLSPQDFSYFRQKEAATYKPDLTQTERYQKIYQHAWKPFQDPLRAIAHLEHS